MPWKRLTEALRLSDSPSFRSMIEVLTARLGLEPAGRADVRRSVAFTVAIIALSAKLSKADGVSCQIEAEAFGEIYHVPPAEQANVRRLFDIAKQDTSGFEAYAEEISRLLADEPQLKIDCLEGLFYVASADGVLHEAEQRYLSVVARVFGLSAAEYRRIKAMYAHDETDPYVVLGLAHEASDAELKAHYRRLVKAHHPDALIGHGVPPEFIDQATAKIAAINAAYAEIAKERGL
jgi:DnaJ like chaperone protein